MNFSTHSGRVGIRNISDYSPFGVLLKERTVESAEFRLGFQGQERDDEIKGEGNSVNFKYRMHDPRVGRFFAVDPLISQYPHYSSYSFSGNKVINAIELEGLEEKKIHTIKIFSLEIQVSFRRFFKVSKFSRIGVRIYKHEDKSPNPDRCWKYKEEEIEYNLITETTEKIRKSHMDLAADMGSSPPPDGVGVDAGIVTQDFKSKKEHSVVFDPHGAADKIRITNLTTGALLFEYDGVLRQEIDFGPNTPIRVELTGRGTHALEVWEQQYEKETTTSTYKDGKLESKSSTTAPTDDLPGNEAPKKSTTETGVETKKVKVECDCDDEGAKKK